MKNGLHQTAQMHITAWVMKPMTENTTYTDICPSVITADNNVMFNVTHTYVGPDTVKSAYKTETFPAK